MALIRASSTGGVTLPLTSRYAWENNVDSRPSTRHSFPERSSKNPFFARNAPHPTKVRHIKGLLDFPICAVFNSDYNENNPKQTKLWFKESTHKQPQLQRKKEKFVPGVGIVNTNQGWLEHLQEFTKNVEESLHKPLSKQNYSRSEEKLSVPSINIPILKSPSRVSIVSRQTQRVSTRSSIRQQTRQQSRPMSKLRVMEENFVRESCASRLTERAESCASRLPERGESCASHIIERAESIASRLTEKERTETVAEPTNLILGLKNAKLSNDLEDSGLENVKCVENETYVLDLLSAILQTDSINDIKRWFWDAPAKEKEVVFDMVRAVANTNRDFREGMSHLQQIKQSNGEEEYERDFLFHEDSLDIEDIRNYNKQKKDINERSKREEEKSKQIQSSILQQLNETISTDIQLASRKSSRNRVINWKIFPNISEEDAEIEDIRKKLSSRSSIAVFNNR